MRRTLRLLGSLFPLPTCTLRLRVGMNERGCLDFFIGRCVGPCRGEVDPVEYRKIVDEAMEFLAGKKEGVLAGLEREMNLAAREQRFEEAARFRDRIFSLRRTVAQQSVAVEGEAETDALAFARLGRIAIGALLQVREGRVIGRDRLEVGCTPNELDGEILRGLLLGFYEPKESFPNTILVPVMPSEPELLSEWLSEKAGHPVRLKVPRRGAGRKILELAKHNAEVALRQEEPRAPASATRSLESLAQAIGLSAPPRRIEGIDISTIQGTDTYASLVVFLDGVNRPDEYRTFRIRDAPRRDDPRSIEEVVRRRAVRIAAQGSAPDLILVDGGPTQLDAAVRALRAAALDIPVISLAKRFEETYLPGRPEPLRLPATSEARLLLQRVRDEAHRFALKSHRRRRGTRLSMSALDEISGIGARKKKLLLERFGSVEAMKRSSIDELAQVPGIGRALALSIWTHLGGAEEA
jgi:excinuclease ABC subunit C